MKHPFCGSVLPQTLWFPADGAVKPTGQATVSHQIAAAAARQEVIIRHWCVTSPRGSLDDG